MPDITALAKVLRRWDALIAACDRNPGLLDGIEPLTDVLKDLLEMVIELKHEQEDLNGQRKDRTQRIRQGVEDGEEAVRQVRNFIKIRLGSRNAQLTQFGITPLGVTRRRRTLPEPQPEPEPPPVVEISPSAVAAGADPPGAPGEMKEAPPAATQTANPQ
jgi:hypothetical protein